MDSSGERHAGLLSADDLASWEPRWEEPVSVDYHGYEVFKAGPWSQAPVFLQQLRLLEGFDLAGLPLAVLDEPLDKLEHLGRLLIGYQARRQLGLGFMGDDGFDADVAIATAELGQLIPDLLLALDGEVVEG